MREVPITRSNRPSGISAGVALVVGLLPYSLPAASETAPALRDVTPPGMTRVFRSEESHELAPENVRRFSNVHVDNNGLLDADGVRLQIYGIVLPPRGKICKSAAGVRSACGQRALIVLRNLVGGRSIACEIKDASNPAIAACKIEGIDIAVSLLEGGWANLAMGVADKNYVAAVSAARARKLGIWADEARSPR